MDDFYVTRSGIKVLRRVEDLPYESALTIPLADIDRYKGAVFASGYEYPGRYSRWDIAFLKPPIEIICYGRGFMINALNDRGKLLVDVLGQQMGYAGCFALRPATRRSTPSKWRSSSDSHEPESLHQRW